MVQLEDLPKDIWNNHLVVFMTFQDVLRLECTCKNFANSNNKSNDEAWNSLCVRDCDGSHDAPAWEQDCFVLKSKQEQQQQQQCNNNNNKSIYKAWHFYRTYIHEPSSFQKTVAKCFRRAASTWHRFRIYLQSQGMSDMIASLKNTPPREFFERQPLPISLKAFYSVHGGQIKERDMTYFHGIFGTTSVYNDVFTMRLKPYDSIHVVSSQSTSVRDVIVATNPFRGEPELLLAWNDDDDDKNKHDDDDQGTMHLNTTTCSVPVCRGGILEYFQGYVDRLEQGHFQCYVPWLLPGRVPRKAIHLFPEIASTSNGTCENVSCAVTRGIEIRASARWRPDKNGLNACNFAYSIRIRLLETATEAGAAAAVVPCQLVSRHWQFVDGFGRVRRVDGEAVVGKQPYFVAPNKYVDLGPAGTGQEYNKTFVYQSQSGYVDGTRVRHSEGVETGKACVQGTFLFVPGTIDNPTGPPFHARVERFALVVPMPYY